MHIEQNNDEQIIFRKSEVESYCKSQITFAKMQLNEMCLRFLNCHKITMQPTIITDDKTFIICLFLIFCSFKIKRQTLKIRIYHCE